MTIGERIRELRKAANMTLIALERKAELTPGHVGQIERGTLANPGIHTIERVAQALGVTVSQLLGETPSGPLPSVESDSTGTHE